MPAPTLNRATLLCALILCLSAAAQKPTPLRPIQIDSGKLLGVLTPDRKVLAYKGIPYAQPPIEELRWHPPQPVGKWKRPFVASDFGPRCIQSGTQPDMVFHDPGPSEDCLTLNVWAPVPAQPTRKAPLLPVMVWIYGGGFFNGSTSEARQDGQFLAHRGVIVVSMNYRLGIFGFFAHPELTAESANHTSGNYGLLDQAAALDWVRRNIAAFGGDAANVTLFGESAGSASVSIHMASPLTQGLFSKAIGESGAEFPGPGRGRSTLTQAEQADAAWAERAFGTSKLFALRLLPVKEILAAAMSTTIPAPHFGPVIDGYFLPDFPTRIFAAGKQAHIPLLAGWNANEARPDTPPTADRFTVQAHIDFGPDALKFLALYPATSDAEAVQSAGDLAGDKFIAFGTWEWLEAQTRTGNAPVYRYFFSLASPGDRLHTPAMGAFHNDEIEYVFGTLDSRPGMAIRPEDRALSDLMQQYWTNFARTGSPNGALSDTSNAAPSSTANSTLPVWPAYTPAANYPVMHLDAHPAAAPDTLRPRYLLLTTVWPKPG
jgi:para-nitrobenzyl esterase